MKWAAVKIVLFWGNLIVAAIVGGQLLLAGAFHDPRWLMVKQEILGTLFSLTAVVFLVFMAKVEIRKPSMNPASKDCKGPTLQRTPYS